ncbi:Uncharacterised protein [Mycobacterium tuberculosis]|nr:Uncharacterised protein [Mycobacterium tuberculosis]
MPSVARQSASSWPSAKPATMLSPGRRSAERATGCQTAVFCVFMAVIPYRFPRTDESHMERRYFSFLQRRAA